jgi:hypothetical protein
MDTSLYASHNKATTTKTRAHRKHNSKLDHNPFRYVSETERQRTWRKTVNVLKLGDAQRELRDLESVKSYWCETVRTIVKQELNEKKEHVARLNARVIIRK